MRPRGVNLFEATLKNDTLEGTVRSGGINFKRPDGSALESLHFSFKRFGGERHLRVLRVLCG